MKKYTSLIATIFAILAAIFYAVNIPLSKLLLDYVSPTFMASFLYLGTGIGVGIMYLFHLKKEDKSERLNKSDSLYVIGMIVLDVLAPIFLMIGINIGYASNASLLSNFEIVATSIIALLIFKEKVSLKLWIAILLITASTIILSFDGTDSFSFSIGSLFVILATICWGFENNCTRKISNKSTHEIVLLKGLCSGTCSFIVALIIGETLPEVKYILYTLLLGFVSYGLSIFLYIKAQRNLGAAKTSAFYAFAPFIGVVLSLIILGDKPNYLYYIALGVMIIGTIFVIIDTFNNKIDDCKLENNDD